MAAALTTFGLPLNKNTDNIAHSSRVHGNDTSAKGATLDARQSSRFRRDAILHSDPTSA